MSKKTSDELRVTSDKCPPTLLSPSKAIPPFVIPAKPVSRDPKVYGTIPFLWILDLSIRNA